MSVDPTDNDDLGLCQLTMFPSVVENMVTCGRCNIALTTSNELQYPMTEYNPSGRPICLCCYLEVYKFFPPGFTIQLTPKVRPNSQFSPTQAKILRLFLDGKGVSEAGAALGLSRDQVHSALRYIKEKVGDDIFTKTDRKLALSEHGRKYIEAQLNTQGKAQHDH
jgi:DNA-binding CsgD family transcriptional regulator